jgi:carbon monoxide dehydrogenase subunit G
MRFENHFDIAAPLDEVWTTVLDVERVAPTVPGAHLKQTGENAYRWASHLRYFVAVAEELSYSSARWPGTTGC